MFFSITIFTSVLEKNTIRKWLLADGKLSFVLCYDLEIKCLLKPNLTNITLYFHIINIRCFMQHFVDSTLECHYVLFEWPPRPGVGNLLVPWTPKSQKKFQRILKLSLGTSDGPLKSRKRGVFRDSILLLSSSRTPG